MTGCQTVGPAIYYLTSIVIKTYTWICLHVLATNACKLSPIKLLSHAVEPESSMLFYIDADCTMFGFPAESGLVLDLFRGREKISSCGLRVFGLLFMHMPLFWG